MVTDHAYITFARMTPVYWVRTVWGRQGPSRLARLLGSELEWRRAKREDSWGRYKEAMLFSETIADKQSECHPSTKCAVTLSHIVIQTSFQYI